MHDLVIIFGSTTFSSATIENSLLSRIAISCNSVKENYSKFSDQVQGATCPLVGSLLLFLLPGGWIPLLLLQWMMMWRMEVWVHTKIDPGHFLACGVNHSFLWYSSFYIFRFSCLLLNQCNLDLVVLAYCWIPSNRFYVELTVRRSSCFCVMFTVRILFPLFPFLHFKNYFMFLV